jgi:hypothetical protein
VVNSVQRIFTYLFDVRVWVACGISISVFVVDVGIMEVVDVVVVVVVVAVVVVVVVVDMVVVVAVVVGVVVVEIVVIGGVVSTVSGSGGNISGQMILKLLQSFAPTTPAGTSKNE